MFECLHGIFLLILLFSLPTSFSFSLFSYSFLFSHSPLYSPRLLFLLIFLFILVHFFVLLFRHPSPPPSSSTSLHLPPRAPPFLLYLLSHFRAPLFSSCTPSFSTSFCYSFWFSFLSFPCSSPLLPASCSFSSPPFHPPHVFFLVLSSFSSFPPPLPPPPPPLSSFPHPSSQPSPFSTLFSCSSSLSPHYIRLFPLSFPPLSLPFSTSSFFSSLSSSSYSFYLYYPPPLLFGRSPKQFDTSTLVYSGLHFIHRTRKHINLTTRFVLRGHFKLTNRPEHILSV